MYRTPEIQKSKSRVLAVHGANGASCLLRSNGNAISCTRPYRYGVEARALSFARGADAELTDAERSIGV